MPERVVEKLEFLQVVPLQLLPDQPLPADPLQEGRCEGKLGREEGKDGEEGREIEEGNCDAPAPPRTPGQPR